MKSYFVKRSTAFIVLIALLCVIAGILFYLLFPGAAADDNITCWALCKPGAQINVRRSPSKSSIIEGYLEVGDSFESDGECRNGFIHCLGIGENGGGWVYCGFVVTDEPQPVFSTYSCVAKNRVACRRWCDGPRIKGAAGWLYNGTVVQVFYRSDEWCITSRGYIKSEWLELYIE